jgi:phosphatidate cytidylyltransferase
MTAVVGVAVLGGLWEFCRLIQSRGFEPFNRVATLMTVALFLDVAFPFRALPPAWPLVIAIALAALIMRKADFIDKVPAFALSLLGASYLGALGGALAALRVIDPAEDGPWRLALLLATVMVADTAAYFVGLAFGRTKLAPAVSPGKTVEGGLGGLVGGGLACLAFVRLSPLAIAPVVALLLGIGVALAGAVGDLAESLFKRWAGVKDSGGLFPGHGGVLDRLDSLLLAAPVLYYYFLCCR